MSVTPDQPAPYAPASAVIDLIERHRSKGLPTPVTGDVLARVGVSGSLIARTLQALVTLDLIDNSGQPTPTLEGIRLSPEAEYRTRIAEWLNSAYADALQYVDPAVDDDVAVRDAFRNYTPVGQQARMVTLFMGLFRHAGVTAEKPATAARQRSAPGKKPRVEKPPLASAPPPQQQAKARRADRVESSGEEFMSALLAKFPDFDPSWPDEIKAKWFEGFETFMKGAAPK